VLAARPATLGLLNIDKAGNMAQQQQLGHKDAALFRQVVRHFENKQYKKGTFLELTFEPG
jgi:hypothetical protein